MSQKLLGDCFGWVENISPLAEILEKTTTDMEIMDTFFKLMYKS